MDLGIIIRDLRVERDVLSVAIECLEGLARHGGKRRGRPPAWLKGIGQISRHPEGLPENRPVEVAKNPASQRVAMAMAPRLERAAGL